MINEVEIMVRINGDVGSIGACIRIERFFNRLFEPLDVCADMSVAKLTGGETFDTAKTVMVLREDAAEYLAAKLTTALVNEMKKRDTTNGERNDR